MKTKLLLLAFVFTSTSIFAQDSTSTKIERYCKLVAQVKAFSKKLSIDIDLGEKSKFFAFKDKRIKTDLEKIKDFNSEVDALNYMGTLGWTLVNAFVIGNGPNIYYLYFKKSFNKSEIDETQKED